MQSSKDNFGKSGQQLWVKETLWRTVANPQQRVRLWSAKHLYEAHPSSK